MVLLAASQRVNWFNPSSGVYGVRWREKSSPRLRVNECAPAIVNWIYLIINQNSSRRGEEDDVSSLHCAAVAAAAPLLVSQ